MVYIMNAQDCHSSALNLATIRNQLFTAITRSKLGYVSLALVVAWKNSQRNSKNFETIISNYNSPILMRTNDGSYV